MGALRLVAISPLLLPSLGAAQERRCGGSDPLAAERSRVRVASILQAKLGRSRVNVAALREAAEGAVRVCSAGDAVGLFHRAVTLDALGEHIDAAGERDDFLALRPERASDPFVRDLRERLDLRVGRITFDASAAPTARLRVTARSLPQGQRAVVVSPGEHEVFAELVASHARHGVVLIGATDAAGGRARCADPTSDGALDCIDQVISQANGVAALYDALKSAGLSQPGAGIVAAPGSLPGIVQCNGIVDTRVGAVRASAVTVQLADGVHINSSNAPITLRDNEISRSAAFGLLINAGRASLLNNRGADNRHGVGR